MPPDDNSATYMAELPAAIRRQAERAEQLAREAGMLNVPDGQATTVVSDQDQAEAPAQENLPLEGGQGTTPEAAPTPEPQVPPVPQQDAWEQRYRSLQGKYDTEIAELRGQMQGYQQLLATMQQPREAPRETQATPPPFVVPAEDRETYGEDLITRSQAWAEARLAPRIAELENRLERLAGRTDQMASSSAAASVESQLDRLVPEWRAINNDTGFGRWLNEPDPFSGVVRRELITHAHVGGDANRTAAFFRAYQREQTAISQPSATQPVQTPPAGGAATLPLESLAAPGRGASTSSGGGASGAQSERRIWTTTQIGQAYREHQRGAWQGRDADWARVEADIFAAQREGRVRPA